MVNFKRVAGGLRGAACLPRIDPAEYWFLIQGLRLASDQTLAETLSEVINSKTRCIIIDFANVIRNTEFFDTLCILLLRDWRKVEFGPNGCLVHRQFEHFLTMLVDLLTSLEFDTRYHFIIVVQNSEFEIRHRDNISIVKTSMNVEYKGNLIPIHRVLGRDATDDVLVVAIYQILARSGVTVAIWSRDLYTRVKQLLGIDEVTHATLVLSTKRGHAASFRPPAAFLNKRQGVPRC